VVRGVVDAMVWTLQEVRKGRPARKSRDVRQRAIKNRREGGEEGRKKKDRGQGRLKPFALNKGSEGKCPAFQSAKEGDGGRTGEGTCVASGADWRKLESASQQRKTGSRNRNKFRGGTRKEGRKEKVKASYRKRYCIWLE